MWSTQEKAPEPAWAVVDGAIQTTPGKGTPVYLLTRDSFSDFELAFEWKAEAAANSGVKYRFQGYWVDGKAADHPGGAGRIEPVALEYQLSDDDTNKDAVSDPKHSTAAIYEYCAAKKDGPAKANVWHTSRIIAKGTHIEHWLDDRKVIDVNLEAPAMQAAFQASSRRGSSALLAKHDRRSSPIALQFHDGVVWFRNLRLRAL